MRLQFNEEHKGLDIQLDKFSSSGSRRGQKDLLTAGIPLTQLNLSNPFNTCIVELIEGQGPLKLVSLELVIYKRIGEEFNLDTVEPQE